jgi:hypothetical protein
LDDGDVGQVIEMIREAADGQGLPVALIVIDTLSRSIPGGDENPGQDTSKAIASADAIRTAFPDSSDLIVAHTGKDQSRGLRGHSNQASNAEFLIKINRDSANAVSSWQVEKQKDGETTTPERFRLDVVDLGVEDEDGEAIASCVLEPVDSDFDAMIDSIGRLGKRASACWEVIQSILGRPGETDRTTTRSAIREELRDKYSNDSTRRSVVSEGLKTLIARGLVEEQGDILRYGSEAASWHDE